MHLGSSPPNHASDPTVQGVIGYVRNGTWHYVAVPALFAELAAETAVELAVQIRVAVEASPDRTEPVEPTEPTEPIEIAEPVGLAGWLGVVRGQG